MRILTTQQLKQDPSLYDEAVQVLRDDGLVCFPGHRQYCLAASLFSSKAVISLVQSKHRSAKVPSLVLIPNESMLAEVAEEIPEIASRLTRAFWPGPLTLVLKPNSELPSKVRKTIMPKKPARIGVRVTEPGHQSEILTRFGNPLLVSSANMSHKVGATSASHVRKNFNHTVDIMIDAGDIAEKLPSTIVELLTDTPKITRIGQIPQEDVERVLTEEWS